MNDALIFNIQKFSVHDGPGIRTTVFLKGCPLRCLWCHNPESQDINKEILYDNKKCVLCGKCKEVCPTDAITIEDGKLTTDKDKCNYCGECVIYCMYGAREVVGRRYSVDEVMKEVMKDKIFYDQSNGGVTLSGGEPLIQIEFVEELLRKLKEEKVHTAIDTSGAVSFEILERAAKYTDLFLYDLKLIDDDKHKEYIGASNKDIIDNLVKLSKIHSNINVRMPIIGNINDNIAHIEKTIELLKELNIKKVNLLPYHSIAKHKYEKLGLVYEDEKMIVPSETKMNYLKEIFKKNGYIVKIGG
ncbi:pyruvate formate lyase activating enzyme [Sedimentibacter acidaminivorans]|uniref:Pyruvate formate lyase activating enzyme n=1 Tax=Sedimentibacter acidaminivorans TaxID=913099 RepID=A0ABS4GFZ0_9FIRM|nr:trans-4-hydroxy-L-proline dehydratase activase [Sedimentibacter acidaminivorans]MBP1926608.1 pyruvate formate lyase activating enzyme [Sedimentibacter acidaminivorans]